MQSTYPLQTPLINVMVTAARKAARGLMRDFGELDHLQVSRKGVVNFVSEADLRAEQTIHAELKKARPKFGFLMEEGGEIAGEDGALRWVVDPLDGTNNFLHAVPYFCISIAVEKRTKNGAEITAGVVYDPVHDEMFMAEEGKGAYVNKRRLRVANQRERDFYFVTGTSRIPNPYMDVTSELTRHASTLECVIRRSGAAALDLAYVAAGRYDATWFAHLNKWDMAAGLLLVREAGGIVTSPAKDENPYENGCVLAATTAAQRVLLSARSA
jgi:myo-inositol-1(or 4)-monophosphatase